MAPPVMNAAVNAKVNVSTLYLISEMVAGSHISCIKFVAGKLSGHKVCFSFSFSFNCSHDAQSLSEGLF